MPKYPNRLFAGWTIPLWIVFAIQCLEIIRRLLGWWSELDFLYHNWKRLNPVLDFILSPPGQFIAMLACVGLLCYSFYSSRNPVTKSADKVDTPVVEPTPNWYICQAMDYIVERLGLTSEPESRKQFTPAIRLLTRQARAGNIHVWGKRIISGRPELEGRVITPEEWRNREILLWAWTPSAKEPQTRSSIDPPEAYQFTDLHVNATEIKAIKWQFGTTTTLNVPWSHDTIPYVEIRQFMSLQEAATVLYEAARKSGHIWSDAADLPGPRSSSGDSPSDHALNWFARLISDKNVKIYGKHPPSRIMEEIQTTNGFFRNGATEFWLKRLPRPTEPAYVELEVRQADLRPLIQGASAGSKPPA